ncbi:MAG: Antitermination regulatory protein [Glaciihabitans sp.]|nr:Antitermination regulatory protein [Glaciihabitans sp.]
MPERRRFYEARRALSRSHEQQSSLCDPFLSLLPVTGASVSILAGGLGQSTVCFSDATAARLDELQFDLGEGPCWQALSTNRPVLANDIRLMSSEWPIFSEAIRSDESAQGVAAMFAFPLKVGSLGIGAVDLFATTVGELKPTEVADASALANVAAWQVLRRILDDQSVEHGGAGDVPPPAYTSRREVHQATGMVLAQLNVSADDAALLLRAHAFASGRSVREVAADIVERRLDFSSTEEP